MRNPTCTKRGPGRLHRGLRDRKILRGLPALAVGSKTLRAFITKTATVRHP